MKGGQLRKCGAVGARHPAYSPGVEALGRQPECAPDEVCPDEVDQVIVGMFRAGHTSEYQRSVYISRGQTFIGLAATLLQKLDVAQDPEFGERLRRLIPLAGYKNPRRFAIDGMGWPDTAGPQRLNQYLKGRIPDVETLVSMADPLRVSVADLLGLHDATGAADEGLKGILQHLLVLEGIEADKADTIASALLGAQRLLRAFPDEEPLPTRTKFAARAAWLQQQPQSLNR